MQDTASGGVSSYDRRSEGRSHSEHKAPPTYPQATLVAWMLSGARNSPHAGNGVVAQSEGKLRTGPEVTAECRLVKPLIPIRDNVRLLHRPAPHHVKGNACELVSSLAASAPAELKTRPAEGPLVSGTVGCARHSREAR